jgi:hypothetical protein
MQPVAYATGLCLAQLSDQARARQCITTRGSPRKGDQHGLWSVVDRHQYPHGRLHLCGRPDDLAGLMAHGSKLRVWNRGIGRFRVCTFQTLGHSTFRLASRKARWRADSGTFACSTQAEDHAGSGLCPSRPSSRLSIDAGGTASPPIAGDAVPSSNGSDARVAVGYRVRDPQAGTRNGMSASLS